MADNLTEKERTLKVIDELSNFFKPTVMTEYKWRIASLRSMVEANDPNAQAYSAQLINEMTRSNS